MWRGASCQKSANERAAQDVDVNIAAKFGGANCLSGHSEFIAQTRLDQILAEITPTITSSMASPE